MSTSFDLAPGTIIASAQGAAVIESSAGCLAVLLGVLAVVLSLARHPRTRKFFHIVPALVFCYFVPTLLSNTRVIPVDSALYTWVKEIVLPAGLVLLTLSLDIRGILRLGPKAVVMLLTGTAGVVIGGPIALWIWQGKLPEDVWRLLSYLAGSWIGGGANGVALQRSFGASDAAIAPIIVVDVAVANIWMAFLLFFAGRHEIVDRWLKADTTAITALERRMADFHAKVARIPTLADLLTILALAFGIAWVSDLLGSEMILHAPFRNFEAYLGAFAWKVILATTVGVVLSFTRARRLEGVGASSLGSVMIYLLVACIGAGADFGRLLEPEARWLFALGLTWMAIHVSLMLVVGRLIHAPFFFIAVGSKANIGGAASAPIVAGAFNPVLAPVGVLLAVAGYVLGTYAGLLCANLCRWVAEGG